MAGLMAETKSSPDSVIFPSPSPCTYKSNPTYSASPLNPCPQCGSKKLWRDGLRSPMFGNPIQRWLCRDCNFRFSDPDDAQKAKEAIETVEMIETKSLRSKDGIVNTHQVCVTETKNLVVEQQTTEVLRRNETSETAKGKLVEFAFWMKKEGYRDATILGRSKLLRILTRREADLYDPESVKKAISKQPWCEGRKANAVDAYSSFLKMVGGTWSPPKYTGIPKLPFVSKETEIDQLVAACSHRIGTFLQMLKETGIRCGEAWQTQWDDFDFETNTVRITPEKNSNPRIFKVSHKLIGMLHQLPRNYGKYVFAKPKMPLDNFRDNYADQRDRIAEKVQNPRLSKIMFKTMRTWKGTMEYHRTKDVLYVMQVLGHKNIKNTLIYIQLEEALFADQTDFISKVAKTEAEACVLIDAGFDFVCDFDGHKLFKKRK
jgi:integrase